jgi:hypothetical protein
MAIVQDFVYSADMGTLRKIVVRISALLVICLIGLYYGVTQYNGLKYATAMDQAQLAHQIADGEGFTTKLVRPLALWQLKEKKGIEDRQTPVDAFPDTVNAPAYPALVATAFKIIRPKFDVETSELKDWSMFSPERVILVLNLLLILLASVLLYCWTRSMFDEEAALVALILFVLCDQVWQLSISGLDFAWTFCLVSGLAWLVHAVLRLEGEERHNLAMGLYLGGAALVGLMGLTRYAFLPLILAYLVLGGLVLGRKWMAVPLASLIWLLLVAPWLVRNHHVSGNPFGLSWVWIYADTPRIEGSMVWRMFTPDAGTFFNYRQFIRSFLYGVEGQISYLSILMGGGVLLAAALGSVLHRFKTFEVQTQRWFWIGVIVLMGMTGAVLFRHDSTQEIIETGMLTGFLPVLCAFGAAFIFIMVERLGFKFWMIKYIVVAAICVVHGSALFLRMAAPAPGPFAYPPYFPPMIILTKSWVEPGEAMMSDIPWATAWYDDRVSLWLPDKIEAYLTFSDNVKKVSAFLLSPMSSDVRFMTQLQKGEYEGWAALITRRIDADFMARFPLPAVTPLPPKEEYLFFCVSRRWETTK